MEKTWKINLGPVDMVPVGQGHCFIIYGQQVAVFRDRLGKLFAVENRCPHRQGPLAEGIMGDGKIVCPLHGHKFDLASGQGSEAHECIKTYRVWEFSGYIMIEFISKLSSITQEVR